MSISVAVFLAIVAILVWKPAAIKNEFLLRLSIFGLLGSFAATALAQSLIVMREAEGASGVGVVSQIAAAGSAALLIFAIIPWKSPAQIMAQREAEPRE